jgi:hypothetical protein
MAFGIMLLAANIGAQYCRLSIVDCRLSIVETSSDYVLFLHLAI